jgi:hypothetical protein
MYLLVLGAINLSSRPLLTTGARDGVALGIAILGFAAAGPMELFLPEATVLWLGPWVWALMVVLYLLGLLLLVLSMRPRLVVYNATAEQLRPILAEVVSEVDHEARWAGESLVLPQLGVQLHLEAHPLTKSVELVSSGPHQNHAGWRELERRLAAGLRGTRSGSNPFGLSLLSFGVAMAGVITWQLARDPAGVTQALNDMLRL